MVEGIAREFVRELLTLVSTTYTDEASTSSIYPSICLSIRIVYNTDVYVWCAKNGGADADSLSRCRSIC